jgi:exodeoxyribonuclease VII small subunit
MPEPSSGEPGDQTFEACLAELQDLVRMLEEGRLGLSESIAGFERGIALLRHCYRTLEQAEQKIEILSGFDETGSPVVTPFDAASTLETGQGAAGRRKKKSGEPTQETPSQAAKIPESRPAPEPEGESELSLPDEGQLF